MLLKRINLFILLLFVVACGQQSVITDINQDTLRKISEKNRQVCAYKGKIVLNYEGKETSLRLKGFLEKDCSKDFRLVLTGLLNMVVMDITYKNGQVVANKNGEDISSLVAYFFKQKNVDAMVEMVRYPYVEIDGTYSLETDGKEYIMKKDNMVVTAGQDMLIKTVEDGKRKFGYEYKDGQMYNITYEYKEEKVEIGLR